MAEKDLPERLRRAVKENNLFAVRRLTQRIDMRNPDPGPGRYTSLAWAAVLGHEETFDFLLNCGHDDHELSRDAENNNVLILLAGLKSNSLSPNKSISDADIEGAAIRMARMYYDRYPYLLDWSNAQGKTSLHVAALKGNEEFVRMICDLGADFDLPDLQGNTPLHYASAWGHVPVVQLLIERGCQFTAKNNEGFTASDYAYSYNTMTILQDTARAQFESNKKARRNIFAQAAAKGSQWGRSALDDDLDDLPRTPQLTKSSASRLRSGSGGSRTTTTSEDDMAAAPGSQVSYSSSSANSSTGSARMPPSNGSPLPPIPSSSPNSPAARSPPSALKPTLAPSSPIPFTVNGGATRTPASMQPLPATLAVNTSTSVGMAALSPIATRMLERDADAMAEYIKRSRSGSSGSSADGKALPPTPSATGVLTNGQSHPFSAQTNELIDGDARIRAISRLRPSMSAASLRPGAPPPGLLPPTPDQRAQPRSRAATANTPSPQPPPTDPLPAIPQEPPTPQIAHPYSSATPTTPPSSIGSALRHPFGFAKIPNGHGRRPSGTLFRELAFR